MKNRVYLLTTVLLVMFAFSLPEAGSRFSGDGAAVGPQMGSVSIPVKSNPSIAQRMVLASGALEKLPGNNQGKISENESPRPVDRVFLPQNDTTQTPGRKRGDRPGSVTILKKN